MRCSASACPPASWSGCSSACWWACGIAAAGTSRPTALSSDPATLPGMPGSADNADPRCFARADLDEAVGRLVAIIRRVRPHVVITYPDIQDGYAHPDHLRVHDITIAAVREANSATAHPWAGPVWDVS